MNLILDTQTWIYLANGYNQLTGTIDEGLHFKLLNDIIDLVDSGKVQILINEIILIEWRRNKKTTLLLIEKCENRIENKKKEFKQMKKSLSAEKKIMVDEIFQEYKQKQKELIQKNEIHIQRVETLLNEKSILVPVLDKHKLEAVELAIHKKAPFHNKANSVGDAVILLSVADYLTGERYEWIDDAIFVSNNSDDYCEKAGSTKIHPDLAGYFAKASMQFETNLARALKLGEKIIKEIDEFNHYMYGRDVISCLMNCKGSEYGLDEVEFNEELKLTFGEPKYIYDPNQLILDFGDEYKLTQEEIKVLENRNSIVLEIGRCGFCNTLHLRCECGAEHAIYDETDSHYECGCGRIYDFNNNAVVIEE